MEEVKIPRVKVKGEVRPSQKQLRAWTFRQKKIRRFIAVRARVIGIMKARMLANEEFGKDWRDEYPSLEILNKWL